MSSGVISHPGIRIDRATLSGPSQSGLSQAEGDACASEIDGPPQFAAPRLMCETASILPMCGRTLDLKRGFDFVSSVVLLIVTAPIVLLGAILVKLTSHGPVFYQQVRLGLDGRRFTLLKLRTMRHNAEAETGPVWSTENDTRVTPLGKLLRRTHIDEFPQLWNVALGEMSLVGPRPERPEFVAKLDREIPHYSDRLKVRPGITGLAQMRLPPDASLESVRRKVMHDVYYVEHGTAWLDFKLLCLTAWRLVKEIGAFCMKCIILPSPEEIERGYRQALGMPDHEPAMVHVSLNSLATAAEGAETETSDVQFVG